MKNCTGMPLNKKTIFFLDFFIFMLAEKNKYDKIKAFY